MGQTPWSAVINLSNSIIGVSVLAMPWCFKECGIILGVLLLLLTGAVNKFSGNILLRASKATRKTTYPFLANHTLGGMGKVAVEVSVILLLNATCIAFFVIIGDLGPSLVSKFTNLENNWNLRTSILLGTAVFIILPLTQKKNIESLSGLSTMSIAFYFFFATSIIIDSLPKLFALNWVHDVTLWRPAGLLKGMSIFALSMCCQPTLFPVYNSLQERTLKTMEDVVSKGVNLVASVYICIGFFGYITYYQDGIKGDILLNQPPSLLSDVLKLLFTLSVAISFPLVVFPCRASIFSLLFPNSADSNPIGGMTFMPPHMFRFITVCILGITLTIAILIPNVEVVLSLTGSTMGSLACFIMPALIYQHATGVPARFMPKILLFAGIAFMMLSTYDNIHPTPVESHIPAPVQVFDKLENKDNQLQLGVDKIAEEQKVHDNQAVNMGLQGDDVIKDPKKAVDGDAADEGKKDGAGGVVEEQERDEQEVAKDKRQEPLIPHAPVDIKPDKVAENVAKEQQEVVDGKDVVVKAKEEEGPQEPADVAKREDGGEEGAGDRPDGDDGEEEPRGDKVVAADTDLEQKGSKEQLDDGEAVEKFKVQEQKQEEQEKKLEELQVRQVIQEKLIIHQAEELDRLKKEHQDDKIKKEAEDEAQKAVAAAAQLAGQQIPAQGQLGQLPVGQMDIALQQPVGQGIDGNLQLAQQMVAGGQVLGQPVLGQQPVAGQPQLLAGQQVLGAQQPQPVAGQQQPLLVQQPLVGQQQPVEWQQQPLVAQQAVAGQVPFAGQLGQVAQGQPLGQVALGGAVVGGAGQPVVQVGIQGNNGQGLGAGGDGMGQNLAGQPRLGQIGPQNFDPGLQHVGLEGRGNLQPQLQAGVGQNAGNVNDGMQQVGAAAFGQALPLPQQQIQGNIPLALQQQPLQQLPQQQQQQQPVVQNQPVPVQQHILPAQQQLVQQQQQQPQQPIQFVNDQANQQMQQVLPDAGQAAPGVAAMGNRGLPQDDVAGGLANDEPVNANLEGGMALQQNQPQPHEVS